MTEEIRRRRKEGSLPSLHDDAETDRYQCKESRSHGSLRKTELPINGGSRGDDGGITHSCLRKPDENSNMPIA